MTLRQQHRVECRAFLAARDRCTNPRNDKWKDYGGRGIKFLFASFEQFLDDLGPRPKGMLLDRKNNDGNYEVGNVRWATPLESTRNRRKLTWTSEGLQRLREVGRQNGHVVSNRPGHLTEIGRLGGSATNETTNGRKGKGARVASHVRWHVKRNIYKPSCGLCQAESRAAAA